MHTLNQLLANEHFITLDAKLRQYNIFKALGIDHYEVRHSKFLAHLLDPNETHGLEAEFLQNFLLWLSHFVVSDIPVNQLDLDMASISTEKQLSNEDENPRRRLDVLIEIPWKKDPQNIYRIAIENKIEAVVGKNQLQDYSNGLENCYKGGVAHKILLTISPEEDESSLESWVNVTHQNTVMKAIDTTIRKIEKTSSSRIIDILNDYNMLLAEQTGNEIGNEELDTLCSHLIGYKQVIELEAPYLKVKFRDAITYLENCIKRDGDLQSKMLDKFNEAVKGKNYCVGNSNRSYLRFYPAQGYPFVRTYLENSCRSPWQKTGDEFVYPLLFEVQMRQKEGTADFLARYCLVLSQLPDNSSDNREKVREKIRPVVNSGCFKEWKVNSRRDSTAKFTLLVSTEWQTISNSDQIKSFLEELFTKTNALAKAIQNSQEVKETVLFAPTAKD